MNLKIKEYCKEVITIEKTLQHAFWLLSIKFSFTVRVYVYLKLHENTWLEFRKIVPTCILPVTVDKSVAELGGRSICFLWSELNAFRQYICSPGWHRCHHSQEQYGLRLRPPSLVVDSLKLNPAFVYCMTLGTLLSASVYLSVKCRESWYLPHSICVRVK